MALSRPLHKKYALKSVSNETYLSFVNGYSIAKKLGVRGVWTFICGSGVYQLCYEALKGEIRRYGRRKLAAGIISCFTWAATPIIPLLSNSTRIIRAANVTHTVIAFVAESCEDCTNLMWLPLDLLLVGQPIPIGEAGRFNIMGGDETLFHLDV